MENTGEYREHICIPTQHEDIIIPVKEIIYIKAANSQADIFTLLKKEEYVSCKPFWHYLEILAHSNFLQIHRSYFVNVIHLLKKTKGKFPDVYLTNDKILPVSDTFKNAVDEYFEKLK